MTASAMFHTTLVDGMLPGMGGYSASWYTKVVGVACVL